MISRSYTLAETPRIVKVSKLLCGPLLMLNMMWRVAVSVW